VQANPDIYISNNNKKNICNIFIYIKKKTYETTINAVLHKEKQILNYVLTTSKRISRFPKKKPAIPNPDLKKKEEEKKRYPFQ
jgi:hypothetical protein